MRGFSEMTAIRTALVSPSHDSRPPTQQRKPEKRIKLNADLLRGHVARKKKKDPERFAFPSRSRKNLQSIWECLKFQARPASNTVRAALVVASGNVDHGRRGDRKFTDQPFKRNRSGMLCSL